MTPDSWQDLTLADIATIVGGGTPSRRKAAYWNGDIPWATPTDVTGLRGRVISDTGSMITEAGLESSSATLLPPGSLLMTTRATIGMCAINRVLMATNQGFQNLVPKQGTYVQFLYYLVQHYRRRLESLAAGSTFLEVSKKTIRGFRLPVPPLPEQRKIAAILSSVDDAIEKTQAVIDQVQVVKRGLMQELLTHGLPGRHRTSANATSEGLPDGWSRKKVSELGKVVTGRTPSTKNQAFWNGTIPFVTPTDLGSAKRITSTGRYLTQEGFGQVKEIPPGTVMVTCIASIGKTAIAGRRCCTNQQINSIIPDGTIVLSDYLYYAICSSSKALVGLAGQTAVPIVSKSKFLTFSLMIPPISEQKEIVRVLSSVDHLIEVNEAWWTTLNEIKLGLMSVLLTGELRVTPDAA